MLVHDFAGRQRAFRMGALVVLLLVTVAISAQAIHFHSAAEAASTSHCVLCETGGITLPVLAIVLECSGDSNLTLEKPTITVAHQSPEGSNLAVRPPPSF